MYKKYNLNFIKEIYNNNTKLVSLVIIIIIIIIGFYILIKKDDKIIENMTWNDGTKFDDYQDNDYTLFKWQDASRILRGMRYNENVIRNIRTAPSIPTSKFTTVKFFTAGQSGTWTPPPGVTKAFFGVIGGKGAGSNPGYGGNITGLLKVDPGRLYTINVGTNASGSTSGKNPNTLGGYNGCDGIGGGGGGGAASIVYAGAYDLAIIVAGGGGGSGLGDDSNNGNNYLGGDGNSDLGKNCFNSYGGVNGGNGSGSVNSGQSLGGSGCIVTNLRLTNGVSGNTNWAGGGGGGVNGGGMGGYYSSGGAGGSYVNSTLVIGPLKGYFFIDTTGLPSVTIVYDAPPPYIQYLGCYKETGARAIFNKLGNVNKKEECSILAKNNNYNIFGLQNSGECWAGSTPEFWKYGVENPANCPVNGGPWSNQVYSLTDLKTPLIYRVKEYSNNTDGYYNEIIAYEVDSEDAYNKASRIPASPCDTYAANALSSLTNANNSVNNAIKYQSDVATSVINANLVVSANAYALQASRSAAAALASYQSAEHDSAKANETDASRAAKAAQAAQSQTALTAYNIANVASSMAAGYASDVVAAFANAQTAKADVDREVANAQAALALVEQYERSVTDTQLLANNARNQLLQTVATAKQNVINAKITAHTAKVTTNTAYLGCDISLTYDLLTTKHTTALDAARIVNQQRLIASDAKSQAVTTSNILQNQSSSPTADQAGYNATALTAKGNASLYESRAYTAETNAFNAKIRAAEYASAAITANRNAALQAGITSTQARYALDAENAANTEEAAIEAQEALLARSQLAINMQNNLINNINDTKINMFKITKNILPNTALPTMGPVATLPESLDYFTDINAKNSIIMPHNDIPEIDNYGNSYNKSIALLEDPNQMSKSAFDTFLYIQNKKINQLNTDLADLNKKMNTKTPPLIKSIKSMNNSKMLNVEAYPSPTSPNSLMPTTYPGNGSTNYPNYLIYGNNGCLQYNPSPTQNPSQNPSQLPLQSNNKSPTWNFNSCNANNPNQQFSINQINTLSQYNTPISSPNNSSYLLNDSTNTRLGFYTVNPNNANDQCLQLNNDGISIMPCNMDASQKFKPFYHSIT